MNFEFLMLTHHHILIMQKNFQKTERKNQIKKNTVFFDFVMKNKNEKSKENKTFLIYNSSRYNGKVKKTTFVPYSSQFG